MIAQVSFEAGHIIDNSGTKVECFIKDLEWSNNPTEFQYKLTEDSRDIITGTLNSIKIFTIGDHTKYKKVTVGVDKSSNKTADMSNRSEPDFITETVFLKYLAEGSANLFKYQDNQILRFFYSINDQNIEQLVYKKFLLNSNSVSLNVSFKKQLYENLTCETMTINDSRNLDYDEDELIAFFQKYNLCSNTESKVYEGSMNKGKFNFSAKVGYFNSNLDIDYGSGTSSVEIDRQSAELGSKSSFRIAAELEYLLPSKNNKWAVFLETGYQSYESSVTIETDSNIEENRFQDISIDYQYIDFNIGVRHYLFLSDNSKLFINTGFVIVADLSDKIDYEDNPGIVDLDINSSVNLFAGIGYDYNNKFTIEARFNFVRDITTGYSIVKSNYNSIGVVFGYKFL
jgi:hypothetical protein